MFGEAGVDDFLRNAGACLAEVWQRTKLGYGEGMRKTRTADGTGFFLLGAIVGAAVALLMAPASGARTRRRLLRKGEEAADYLMTASKELIDRCEDLCERGRELVEDAGHELSSKYRALLEYSKQAVGEAEAILRHTKTTVSSR